MAHPVTIEPVIEKVLRECIDDLTNAWRLTGYPVLIFGTVSETTRVPSGLLSCFKQDVSFEVGRLATSNGFTLLIFLRLPMNPNGMRR